MSWPVPLPLITRESLALPFNTCRLRKLIPNLEHVTWREPTVTPSDLAISSSEIPSATQSLIFWMLAGVNFVAIRPLGPAITCNVIVNPYDGSGPEFDGDGLSHPHRATVKVC